MFKQVRYILDRRQKAELFILLIVILGGALTELLGISGIMPLVQLAMDPDTMETKWYFVELQKIIHVSTPSELLFVMAIALIFVYIFKNVYISLMYNMQYRFIFDNQRKLAVKMMDVYMHQSYLFHVSRNVAVLQRNVTEDVNGFYTVVLNVMQLIAEVSVSILLIIYLMRTDISTTLVFAGIIAFFSVLVGVVFKKILVRMGRQNRETCIKVNQWILQSFSGIKEIKVMGRENFFLSHYDSEFKKFTVLQRKQSMLSFMPRPLMETACICGLLLTFAVKIYFFNTDVTTFIPALTAFAVAAIRLLPAFNRVSGYMGGIMFDKPSVEVLYNDLVEIEKIRKDMQYEQQDSPQTLQFERGIYAEHISFQYPDTDKWVLRDASLEIQPNTSIALIGSSGSGKTTLADVILGILTPQKGRILVGTDDIRSNMKQWHQSIGYIPQTIYLTDDTIRANIAFGIDEDKISDEAIHKALEEAQLSQFVASLPEGLDTIVGDRGVKLSGGQRQRIGIARALYSQPPILVLDEATSALDNETEREVMEAIDGLHGNRTLIIIAHRLSTIKNCDVIYEVTDGNVVRRQPEEVFGE